MHASAAPKSKRRMINEMTLGMKPEKPIERPAAANEPIRMGLYPQVLNLGVTHGRIAIADTAVIAKVNPTATSPPPSGPFTNSGSTGVMTPLAKKTPKDPAKTMR